jgi:arylsulfatase A-like enzyme
MLTGMLPTKREHLSNEVFQNFIANQPEQKKPETFIHHLKRNGYYTLGIGKISHSADGYLYDYTADVSAVRELPHSWSELAFNPGKWGTGWNAFFGYADGSNRQSRNRQVKPYEMADVDDAGYPDGLIAELAIGKLSELVQKKEPFFLGVGFFKPHLPFNAPLKYWDLYDRDSINLSATPFIPKHVNKSSLHSSGEFNSYEAGDEKPSLSGPVSDEYARTLRHAYYACISYIDAQVGKLLNELEALGIADNTIIVVWGDHGWHLGDQLVWGKHTLFENALRSALILKIPGITGGQSVKNIVSSIDLYPTLMEACGVSMPHATDGKSLLPLLSDSAGDWNGIAYAYFKGGVTIRTERYRLTQYFRSQEPKLELYDSVSDPEESVNIANERPEVVKQLLPLLEGKNIYK